jgi:hypothetical protein
VNIINKAITFDYSINQLKDQIILDNGKSSIFSDGTIFHVEKESGEDKGKFPLQKKDNWIWNKQITSQITKDKMMSSISNYGKKSSQKEKVLILAR